MCLCSVFCAFFFVSFHCLSVSTVVLTLLLFILTTFASGSRMFFISVVLGRKSWGRYRSRRCRIVIENSHMKFFSSYSLSFSLSLAFKIFHISFFLVFSVKVSESPHVLVCVCVCVCDRNVVLEALLHSCRY